MSKVTVEAVTKDGPLTRLVNFTNVSTGKHRVLEVTAPVGRSSGLTLTPTTEEKFMVLSPPSTEKGKIRLSNSTADVGLRMVGTQFLSIVSTRTYSLYTTESTSIPVRVVLF